MKDAEGLHPDLMGHTGAVGLAGTMRDADYYNEVYSGRYHVDEDRVRYVGSLCAGSVLDIGCGDGRLAQFVEGQYLGTDFSARGVELAAERNPGKTFVVHDFLREPLPKGPWQTIVMGELLEHLDSRAEAVLLKKAGWVLAKNGRVIATVPKGSSVPDVSHVQVFEDGLLADRLACFGSTVEHRYSDKYLIVSAHCKCPTLSVVLIVKNEEELLAKCLDSLKDIWDELVIVDTGSTDKTVEIAKSYGARMGFYQWHSDFASARNYAESLAIGKYNYVQDADEILIEGHAAIRQIVEEGKLDGIAPTLIMARDAQGRVTNSFVRQEMLHRNDGKWSWAGAAHNWLRGTGRLERPDIVIEHLTRPSGDRPNHDSMIKALYSNFKEGLPERQLFYLARQRFYQREWYDCIGLVSLLLNTERSWPLQRSQACLLAGDAWLILGEKEAARQTYLKALAEHSGWADPYYRLGKQARAEGRKVEAIGWLLASTAYEPGGFSVDHGLYECGRWDELALACHQAGRHAEALKYGKRALTGRPESERLMANLGYYEEALSTNGAKE